MTTIAYDHKNGILAADTQLTVDDVKIISSDKISILNRDTIFAGAGDTHAIILAERFFRQEDWESKLERPAIPLEKDADDAPLDAILIFKGQPFLVDRHLVPEPLCHPFYAVGSGWKFAMAAMSTGMSAADAVEFASKFDIYTNNKVRVLNVKEFYTTKKLKGRARRAAPLEAKETGGGEAPVQGDNGG